MRHRIKKLNIRLMAMAMAVMLLLCAAPAASAAEADGTCGDNLTWSLSGDTLTITGSGGMYDFTEPGMAPWYEYRNQIAVVNLPEGLTRVGDLAFFQCKGLKAVFLPDSVTHIGRYAFSGCTGLVMLDLGSSVKEIREGAFKECTGLPDLRLPETLTTIGFQAFYRCESLTQITVPASVTELGMTAFAFCYDLIRADIRAPITVLPDWTFYGCTRLTTVLLPDTLTGANGYAFYDCTTLSEVKYDGSQENLEQIQADIQRDLEGGDNNISVNDENSQDNESFTYEENEEGIVASSGTTTQTENGSVSTDVTASYPGGDVPSESSAEVTVTLENEEGWTEVSETVEQTVEQADETVVTIYLKDETPLPEAVIDTLAGKHVLLTVHTANGSVWKIDCSQLEPGTEFQANLSYERTDATPEQLQKLGCTVAYQIRFLADAQINAEVMLKLPVENARKTAALYQDLNGLNQLQNVMVDNEGYAHFYLGSVDSEITYLIGIDVPGVDPESAIIPQELFALMGVTDTMDDVEYIITGRSSSWGIDINQVTVILIASMTAVIAIVGVTMYLLNKRKLKMGYVPDLDDEDE